MRWHVLQQAGKCCQVVLAGSGRWCEELVGAGKRWHVLAFCCKRLQVLEGVVKCWHVLADVGRCCQALAGAGRCWQAVTSHGFERTLVDKHDEILLEEDGGAQNVNPSSEMRRKT